MLFSFRLAYILGSATHKSHPSPSLSEAACLDRPFVFHCNRPPVSTSSHIANIYNRDTQQLCRYANSSSARFVVSWGDRVEFNIPLVAKARKINNSMVVVAPLNVQRHWSLPHMNDVEWRTKKPELVWRGTTTGSGLRKRYVDELSARGYDVKFNSVCQGKHNWRTNPITNRTNMAPSMSMDAMLRYKYLLVLEGNDVATGLKWAMKSNSVVVMPRPTKETWLLEGLLVPYVHYVPLDDPRDVDTTVAWMKANDRACQKISANAGAWLRDIMNVSVQNALLRRVMNYVTF